MPESTPLTKVQGVREFGANVILHGSNYDEAYAYAVTYGKENGYTFVHPFTDEEVMAGQGTIALEMLEEVPDLDAMIVPVGGGGLISGMSVAAKTLKPEMKVIAVSAEGAPAMKNSYDAGQPLDTTSVRTIADGIAVRDTSPITLEYILKNVDSFESVCDDEIASAIANIVQIGYDRTSIDLEFGDAHVSVALETKGEEHQALIRQKLTEGGFAFREEH